MIARVEQEGTPTAFRQALKIDAGGILRPLAEVMAPWQAADFAAVDGGWMRAVGMRAEGGYSRSYWERSRGASKSQDIAAQAAWALYAAKRPIQGLVAAADLDQAKLVRDALLRLVQGNPWLARRLVVDKLVARNCVTGSQFRMIPADAASAYGFLVDFVLIDELSNVRSEDFVTAVISTAAKKPNCFVGIISNAGYNMGTGWQWRVREAARTDPTWYFSRLDGPPPWVRPEHLAEQRRLLPPSAYRRLWLNEWTTGAGDALSPEDIAAAFRGGLEPMTGRESEWAFSAGLDLGVSRDWSAFVVVAKHERDGLRRVARVWAWRPPAGGRVDLEAVQAVVREASRQFGLHAVAYDPWQSELLSQQLQREGIRMVETPFSGANLTKMAAELVEAFQSNSIVIPGCYGQLRDDLARLSIEAKPYGYKLVADRTASGHADTATALALGLVAVRDAVEPAFFMEYYPA